MPAGITERSTAWVVGLDHRFAFLPGSGRSPCSKKSFHRQLADLGMLLLDTTGIRRALQCAATLKDLRRPSTRAFFH
jgi:hypothetical protein